MLADTEEGDVKGRDKDHVVKRILDPEGMTISMLPIPAMGHCVDPSPRVTNGVGSMYGRMDLKRCLALTMCRLAPLSTTKVVVQWVRLPWRRGRAMGGPRYVGWTDVSGSGFWWVRGEW